MNMTPEAFEHAMRFIDSVEILTKKDRTHILRNMRECSNHTEFEIFLNKFVEEKETKPKRKRKENGKISSGE